MKAPSLFLPCATGEGHPETLACLNNLAVLLKKMQKFAEAETLYRRALAGQERRLGPQHPDTLDSVSSTFCVHLFLPPTPPAFFLSALSRPWPFGRVSCTRCDRFGRSAEEAQQEKRVGALLSSCHAWPRPAARRQSPRYARKHVKPRSLSLGTEEPPRRSGVLAPSRLCTVVKKSWPGAPWDPLCRHAARAISRREALPIKLRMRRRGHQAL
jgi:hypothetical protein